MAYGEGPCHRDPGLRQAGGAVGPDQGVADEHERRRPRATWAESAVRSPSSTDGGLGHQHQRVRGQVGGGRDDGELVSQLLQHPDRPDAGGAGGVAQLRVDDQRDLGHRLRPVLERLARLDVGVGLPDPLVDGGVRHPARVQQVADDRPGGAGQTDIYVTELQADGSWGPQRGFRSSAAQTARPGRSICQDGLQEGRLGAVRHLQEPGRLRRATSPPRGTTNPADRRARPTKHYRGARYGGPLGSAVLDHVSNHGRSGNIGALAQLNGIASEAANAAAGWSRWLSRSGCGSAVVMFSRGRRSAVAAATLVVVVLRPSLEIAIEAFIGAGNEQRGFSYERELALASTAAGRGRWRWSAGWRSSRRP